MAKVRPSLLRVTCSIGRFIRTGWWLTLTMLILLSCSPAPREPAALDTTTMFSQPVLAELPLAPTYRIGINTEVTGTGAQIGDLSIRAARLAIEEINATGGVNGTPLELVVRDCRSDAQIAVEQYREAIANDDLVALLGPFKSAYAVHIVPEHRDADLPMFIGATNATLTQQGDENLFRMRPSDRLTAAAMVALAVDQLGAQRIGMIYDSDAFGSGGAEQVTANLVERELSPIATQTYITGAREFDAQVRVMLEADIDGLLIYGTNSTDVGSLLRTIRYWNLDVPIITSPGGASAVTYNIAAEAQDGIFVAMDAFLGATSAGREFERTFTERFDIPPDTYIAWYYDSIYLVADVLRQHGDDPAIMSEALRTINYEGVQGAYRFDDDGEGLHDVTLVQMIGGQPEPIGVYSADGFVAAEQAHMVER